MTTTHVTKHYDANYVFKLARWVVRLPCSYYVDEWHWYEDITCCAAKYHWLASFLDIIVRKVLSLWRMWSPMPLLSIYVYKSIYKLIIRYYFASIHIEISIPDHLFCDIGTRRALEHLSLCTTTVILLRTYFEPVFLHHVPKVRYKTKILALHINFRLRTFIYLEGFNCWPNNIVQRSEVHDHFLTHLKGRQELLHDSPIPFRH